MDVLRIIAENKIAAAQAEGAFDNLEGKGKRIDLEAAHPAGDDRFMANHILKANHFLPVWLEDRKQLQKEIADVTGQVAGGSPLDDAKQETIRQLNRRISGYNLRVPVDSLRLKPVLIQE
jgi:hypothetical protein